MCRQNWGIVAYWAAALAALALLGPLAGEGRGDFVLQDSDEMTVGSYHSHGYLYDMSRAVIPSGGQVDWLYAYDASAVDLSGGNVGAIVTLGSPTVAISGGTVGTIYGRDSCAVNLSGGWVQSDIFAENSSTVNMTGGRVNREIRAIGSSTVNVSGGSASMIRVSSTVHVSGGSLGWVAAFDSSDVDISGGGSGVAAYGGSDVDISGGSVWSIYAFESSDVHICGGSLYEIGYYDSARVTFDGRNFRAAPGLIFDGERVLGGSGILSGEWMDGTPWAVNIQNQNAAGAIPEAASILSGLVCLGMLAAYMRSRFGT